MARPVKPLETYVMLGDGEECAVEVVVSVDRVHEDGTVTFERWRGAVLVGAKAPKFNAGGFVPGPRSVLLSPPDSVTPPN